MDTNYSELRLGDESRAVLLKNFTSALGYTYSGPQELLAPSSSPPATSRFAPTSAAARWARRSSSIREERRRPWPSKATRRRTRGTAATPSSTGPGSAAPKPCSAPTSRVARRARAYSPPRRSHPHRFPRSRSTDCCSSLWLAARRPASRCRRAELPRAARLRVPEGLKARLDDTLS